MKLPVIAVLLGLAATQANAEVFATTKNNAGGEIVLLDTQGNCAKGENAMFARVPSGETTFGCWFFNDPYFYVKYSNGTVRVYDANGWTLSPKYQAKNNNSKGMM